MCRSCLTGQTARRTLSSRFGAGVAGSAVRTLLGHLGLVERSRIAALRGQGARLQAVLGGGQLATGLQQLLVGNLSPGHCVLPPLPWPPCTQRTSRRRG